MNILRLQFIVGLYTLSQENYETNTIYLQLWRNLTNIFRYIKYFIAANKNQNMIAVGFTIYIC